MSDNEKPTVFNIETLNAIGARLRDHADAITNAARRDVAVDLRLAARIAAKFASLRSGLGQIADKAINQHPSAPPAICGMRSARPKRGP